MGGTQSRNIKYQDECYNLKDDWPQDIDALSINMYLITLPLLTVVLTLLNVFRSTELARYLSFIVLALYAFILLRKPIKKMYLLATGEKVPCSETFTQV